MMRASHISIGLARFDSLRAAGRPDVIHAMPRRPVRRHLARQGVARRLLRGSTRLTNRWSGCVDDKVPGSYDGGGVRAVRYNRWVAPGNNRSACFARRRLNTA